MTPTSARQRRFEHARGGSERRWKRFADIGLGVWLFAAMILLVIEVAADGGGGLWLLLQVPAVLLVLVGGLIELIGTVAYRRARRSS